MIGEISNFVVYYNYPNFEPMKQLMMSMFSMILVVQVFLGTTGVIVYEHHCKKDGTSRSFFVALNHDGDIVDQPSSCAVSSCCAKKDVLSDDFPFVQKESCCTNSTDYVQLDTDLAAKNGEHVIQGLDEASFQTVYSERSSSAKETSFPYRAPPPLLTSRRLAHLQTYLI